MTDQREQEDSHHQQQLLLTFFRLAAAFFFLPFNHLYRKGKEIEEIACWPWTSKRKLKENVHERRMQNKGKLGIWLVQKSLISKCHRAGRWPTELLSIFLSVAFISQRTSLSLVHHNNVKGSKVDGPVA